MRLRPYLVTALVVAGIVAAFVVAERKLRAEFGFADGPNGVSVEQADDADGIRIVVIRSRFLDETARYRPDGTLLSRDLKAILEDDADRVGTFRIAIKGNRVAGTERYDFDKHARTRTWTRYGTGGALLATGTEDEDTGVEWWWDASGKVVSAKKARQIIDGDDSALSLDAPEGMLFALPPINGVQAGRDPILGPGYSCQIRSRDLSEVAVFEADGTPRSRRIDVFLRSDAARIVSFSIAIRKNLVVGTSLTDFDVKRQRFVTRTYGPDGVLLYVEKGGAPGTPPKKGMLFSPDGRSLTQAEVDDIEATNGDENGIVIPIPSRK